MSIFSKVYKLTFEKYDLKGFESESEQIFAKI